jgi:hypothetical protein
MRRAFFCRLRLLAAAPELNDAPAIALGGPAIRERERLLHGLAFFSEFEARLAAGVGLTIEGLRNRGGAAHGTELKNLYFIYAALVFDAKSIARVNLSRGFGSQPIRLNPPDVARSGRQGACLEEARGPKPFVDPYGIHWRFSEIARMVSGFAACLPDV